LKTTFFTDDCLRRCSFREFKLARRAGGLGDLFLDSGAESAWYDADARKRIVGHIGL